MLRDGPIFQILRCSDQYQESSDGLKEAIQLLNTAATWDQRKDNLDPLSYISIDAIGTLINTANVREKLSTLRKYRSSLLQIDTQHHTVNDDNAVIGVYRILLESTLSDATPHPMKKAASACLLALIKFMNESKLNAIHDSIIASVLHSELWSNPVQSLFDMLSYQPTLSNIQTNTVMITDTFNLLLTHGKKLENIVNEYSFQSDEIETDVGVISTNASMAIDQGIGICSTLKLFLTSFDSINHLLTDIDFQSIVVDLLESLMQTLVLPLISCKATSSDSLSVATVAMGHLKQWLFKFKGFDCSLIANESYMFGYNTSLGLPELNKVAIFRGIVATLPNEVLFHPFQSNGQALLMELAELLLDVASVSTDDAARLAAIKGLDTVMGRLKNTLKYEMNGKTISTAAKRLSQKILHLSISTWESPPSRQIESVVPVLFNNLVSLLEELDKVEDTDQQSNSIDLLVRTIISQPVCRKGRYVALDALLPKIGATKLFALAEERNINNTSLIASFFTEIGKRGNTSGAVAELLAKILNAVRIESQINFQYDEGQQMDSSTKKWCNLWIPSLVESLLIGSRVQKTAVASFWLPQIPKIVGGVSCKTELSLVFAIILEKVIETGRYGSEKSFMLWAGIEIIRQAEKIRLLTDEMKGPLKNVIQTFFPEKTLMMALTHESSLLRIAAFQSINPILMTYDTYNGDPYLCSIAEINLWRNALPYACKSSEKEYLSTLSKAMIRFLIHLSDVEYKRHGESDDIGPSQLLVPFVINFLLDDLFVSQTAYPGTVSDKEKFALILMDTVVSFATQRDSFDTCNRLSKNSSKKVKPIQKSWNSDILSHILSETVMTTLFSLLHSQWDGTRATVYQIFLNVLDYGRSLGLSPVPFLTSPPLIQLIESRGIHLASSPRQRESDAGARILAILCLSRQTQRERHVYLQRLSTKLKDRVDMMETSLVLDHKNRDPMNQLPLAHGLLQTVRLILDDASRSQIFTESESSLWFELMTSCVRSIEISLVVVADIKENEIPLESQESWRRIRSEKCTNVPLNVNTGAIGANGNFTSIHKVDHSQIKNRLVTQRIIMGSWFLIKEASALLPSIARNTPNCETTIISSAGSLLISCLTTLKHQGAAFAAHKSLQSLCSICYSPDATESLRKLPSLWAKRFLNEISGKASEVRDSTLRRSTGYGLGFLAILRTENLSPRFLFPYVLANIIKLSLPPASTMKSYMTKWAATSNEMFIFTKDLSTDDAFVTDSEYNNQSRIHALNILRLIILDAPLAKCMREYVGDCIISALIGYKDSSWNIRNSSTMTFSAAMLRVIDANKNADSTFGDEKRKSTGNSITCKELFRSYPSLLTVLIALMTEENMRSDFVDSIHPTLFPLFLLLARLRPLSHQRAQANENHISDILIEPILEKLGHVHHKVRIVASRALAVLCVSENSSHRSSRYTMIQKMLSQCNLIENRDHNLTHGILLAIQALLRSAQNPETFYTNDLLSLLSYFGSWGNFTGKVHPYCASVMLEIQYHRYMRAKLTQDLEMEQHLQNELHSTSLKVICMIEELTRRGHDYVGLESLARVSSSIACMISFDVVFNVDVPSSIRSKYMSSFKHCITSKNYDVMLHSAKSFKKRIYDVVDTLGDISGNMHDLEILQSVASICIQCVMELLYRKIIPHPPTIRRLTRIALECIYVYKRKVGDSFCFVNTIGINRREFWIALKLLLSLGGFSLEQNSVNYDALGSGNGIASNALELCSLYIGDIMSEGNEFTENKNRMEILAAYVDLIRQSCHPFSSWKVRFSAALGTRHSCILERGMNNRDAEIMKSEILLQLIELFQDSDEDVRREVGNTLFHTTSDCESVSLLNLEKITDLLSEMDDRSRLYLLLLNRILGICNSVTIHIDAIRKEYTCTITCNDSLNLDTDREIFEEEDPNPYEEDLVTLQISIFLLCMQPKLPDNDETEVVLLEIQKLCAQALTAFHEVFVGTGRRDVAHNLSFEGNVFPLVHGLLLASSYGSWVGIDDIFGLSSLCNIILENENALLHPCMQHALITLKSVITGDPQSLENIKRCCFLLPFTRQNMEFTK
jgi:hypothetical protein